MAEVPGGGSDPLARALRDEWGALGLMSYHGVGTALKGEKMWRADLDPDDVGKIRALLMLAASELAGLRERLAETEAGYASASKDRSETWRTIVALRVERDTAVDALREILDIDAVDWDAIGGKAFSIAERALAAVGGQTAP